MRNRSNSLPPILETPENQASASRNTLRESHIVLQPPSPSSGLTVTDYAKLLINRSVDDVYFCGICDTLTGNIYLCPLSPVFGNASFPSGPITVAEGKTIKEPIVHAPLGSGYGNPSHVQFSEILGLKLSKCIGFTVHKTPGLRVVISSFTSRSINGQNFKFVTDQDKKDNIARKNIGHGPISRNPHGRIGEDWAEKIQIAIRDQIERRATKYHEAPF